MGFIPVEGDPFAPAAPQFTPVDVDPFVKQAKSVLGEAGVTIGSVGGQFNEGLAQSVDMIPQMGRWIRRQFDSSIPELKATDPGGVRTALKSVGIPVGDLETQGREYGVEDGPVRRIVGTAAKIAGQSVPFLPFGPAAPGLRATGIMSAAGAAGNEVGGPEGETAATLLSLPLALRRAGPRVAAAPTKEDFAARAKATYNSADAEKTIIPQASFARFVESLEPKLVARTFDKDFHPLAFKTYAKMAGEAERGNITLKSVDSLRGWINEAKANAKPRDAGMIKVMRDALDDFVVSMPGAPQYRQAADLYRRQRGLERIEKLVERAKTSSSTYTAAGYDTALRNQFKAFVKSKEMRFFTQPEREAFERIARGTPIGNVMRQLGRLAPQNILHTLLLANTHPGALALTVPGAGARFAASKSTQRNIKLAQDLIARGYPVPPSLRKYLNPAAVPGAAGPTLSQTGQQ